VLKAFTPG